MTHVYGLHNRIAEITKEELIKVIKPFMREEIKPQGDFTGCPYDIAKVIEIPESARVNDEGEVQFANPFTGSSTGHNFSVNIDKNIFHDFHGGNEGVGGKTIDLIAIKHELISYEDFTELKKQGKRLSDEIYDKACEIGRKTYNFDISPRVKRESKKNNTKDENIIVTSRVIHKQVLYEQVYNPETQQSEYLGYDNGKLIRTPFIKASYFTYYPIVGEELQKEGVLLPRTATDYGSTEDLIKEIHIFVHKYLDIKPEHEEKAVWYILLTWVSDRLNTIPYLRILGDYGTGKSRYLDVIGGLCYKPSFNGGAITSAPIYRIMDNWNGTLILDEFTLRHSDDSMDIIQILNNGYQRNKPITRCDKNDSFKVKYFEPFGGKVISSRKGFSDTALESRCITAIAEETERKDIPIDIGATFRKERSKLQEKLLMYKFKNQDKIDPEKTYDIDFGEIQPRLKQSYLPFCVLFNDNEKILKKFLQDVKGRNKEIIEKNADSWDGRLITHFLEYRLDEKKNVTAKILSYLLQSDGFNANYCNASGIGKRMIALGFESKMARDKNLEKETTIRKYIISTRKLSKLLKKYVSDDEKRKNWEKLIKQAATGGIL